MNAAEHHELGGWHRGRVASELERVTGDVGKSDHLVTLVMMAKYERTVAKPGPGLLGPPHQGGIGLGGQFSRAGDAALGVRIRSWAEHEQRKRAARLSGDVVVISWPGDGAVFRPGNGEHARHPGHVILASPVPFRRPDDSNLSSS